LQKPNENKYFKNTKITNKFIQERCLPLGDIVKAGQNYRKSVKFMPDKVKKSVKKF
jgi:hypothetical protein